MRRLLTLIVTLALSQFAAPVVLAQSNATLIADRVQVQGNANLVAEGNVEVLYNGVRLSAARILYDRDTDSLQITGPIRIDEGERFTIVADSAELDGDLENGILQSARLVLDQQLQLAAAEITRVDGRYTQLYKTVASSCHVCEKNPVPLWQIRAEKVIHDQVERQLYFDNATVRVAGFPIFYLPRLRLPDPTLKRATGFLIPELRTTSRLGTGFKIPYFIALGDHRDLTVTPYLSSGTATLELGYRQAFRNGALSINGAYTSDDILPGQTRGYVFAEGAFRLKNDYRLSFDVESTSDDSYLLDYGYSDKDRLDSAIALERTKRNTDFSANLVHFRSLRTTESNSTQPTLVGDVVYQRRFQPTSLGGWANLSLEAHSHYRTSDLNIDSADADTIVDGRDVTRASARLDWKRSWIFANGIEATAETEFNADVYSIDQDATSPSSVTRFTPLGAVSLRWPHTKTTARGVSHVIEPMVQFVYSNDFGTAAPNEDSTHVEFDEGNLFSFSRFPGSDAYERGLRTNVGLTWTRYDPAGWSLGLTVGRIIRQRDLGQFNAGSGLNGSTSDWLVAAQLSVGKNLTLTNRALFDDGFNFAKNEARLAWNSEKFSVASSYVWMAGEAGVNAKTSEWTMDGSYSFSRHWTGKFDWRYDFIAEDATSAGVGLVYHNECIEVDLSLARRFTSSTSVRPETNFSVSVALAGLGNGRRAHRDRSACYG